MRKYFAGLVIAALLGAPQANAEEGSTQQATPSASEPYQPSLGDIMARQQMRHMKLWFAGRARNWPLADYEVDRLKGGFDEVERCSAAIRWKRRSAVPSPLWRRPSRPRTGPPSRAPSTNSPPVATDAIRRSITPTSGFSARRGTLTAISPSCQRNRKDAAGARFFTPLRYRNTPRVRVNAPRRRHTGCTFAAPYLRRPTPMVAVKQEVRR